MMVIMLLQEQLKYLQDSDKSISELFEEFPSSSSTPELNISVTDKTKFTIINKFADEL